MRKSAASLIFAASLMSGDANAISRYDSQSMSCARVQAVLRAEGAAILSWRSRTNAPLYNRFVYHGGFCENTEVTRLTSVPTTDNPTCEVLRCIPKSHDR